MGNEEWVGGWPDDLSTTRSGPTTHHQHLPALSSSSIDRPHFCMCRRKSNCFTVVLQDVCELGEVERKLHRRWLLCFLNTQFTHLLGLLSVLCGSFRRDMTWAYGSINRFNLMSNMIDRVLKPPFCIWIVFCFVSTGLQMWFHFEHALHMCVFVLPACSPN